MLGETATPGNRPLASNCGFFSIPKEVSCAKPDDVASSRFQSLSEGRSSSLHQSSSPYSPIPTSSLSSSIRIARSSGGSSKETASSIVPSVVSPQHDGPSGQDDHDENRDGFQFYQPSGLAVGCGHSDIPITTTSGNLYPTPTSVSIRLQSLLDSVATVEATSESNRIECQNCTTNRNDNEEVVAPTVIEATVISQQCPCSHDKEPHNKARHESQRQKFSLLVAAQRQHRTVSAGCRAASNASQQRHVARIRASSASAAAAEVASKKEIMHALYLRRKESRQLHTSGQEEGCRSGVVISPVQGHIYTSTQRWINSTIAACCPTTGSASDDDTVEHLAPLMSSFSSSAAASAPFQRLDSASDMVSMPHAACLSRDENHRDSRSFLQAAQRKTLVSATHAARPVLRSTNIQRKSFRTTIFSTAGDGGAQLVRHGNPHQRLSQPVVQHTATVEVRGATSAPCDFPTSSARTTTALSVAPSHEDLSEDDVDPPKPVSCMHFSPEPTAAFSTVHSSLWNLTSSAHYRQAAVDPIKTNKSVPAGDLAAALQLLSLPLPWRSSYPTPVARCLGFKPSAAPVTGKQSQWVMQQLGAKASDTTQPLQNAVVDSPLLKDGPMPLHHPPVVCCSPPRRQHHNHEEDEVVIVPALENICMLTPPPPPKSSSSLPLAQEVEELKGHGTPVASEGAMILSSLLKRQNPHQIQLVMQRRDEDSTTTAAEPTSVKGSECAHQTQRVTLKQLFQRSARNDPLVRLPSTQGSNDPVGPLRPPHTRRDTSNSSNKNVVASVPQQQVRLSLGEDKSDQRGFPSTSTRSLSPCIVARDRIKNGEEVQAVTWRRQVGSTRVSIDINEIPFTVYCSSRSHQEWRGSAAARRQEGDQRRPRSASSSIAPSFAHASRSSSPQPRGVHDSSAIWCQPSRMSSAQLAPPALSSSSGVNPCLVRRSPSPNNSRTIGDDIRWRHSQAAAAQLTASSHRSMSPAVILSSSSNIMSQGGHDGQRQGQYPAGAADHHHHHQAAPLPSSFDDDKETLLDHATAWARQHQPPQTQPQPQHHRPLSLLQQRSNNLSNNVHASSQRGYTSKAQHAVRDARDQIRQVHDNENTGCHPNHRINLETVRYGEQPTAASCSLPPPEALPSTPPPTPRTSLPPSPQQRRLLSSSSDALLEVSPETPPASTRRQPQQTYVEDDMTQRSTAAAPTTAAESNTTAAVQLQPAFDRKAQRKKLRQATTISTAPASGSTISTTPANGAPVVVAKKLNLHDGAASNSSHIMQPPPPFSAPMMDEQRTPPPSTPKSVSNLGFTSGSRIPGVTPYVELLKKASRELHDLRTQRDQLMHLVDRLSSVQQQQQQT
ncbi:Hypothetical protein, putative [Bodo saltans]|uniref:Uncharacterized protein n=1 Tax=Bodo saltans TaxID=75058 RepID=A0A0S4ITN4_BODSA|nr:Hypothetical protein, putative [Bodo saltans]|eukprot:CUF76668.1 Hypothetical protein, putative [Bodo saltans]